jgi:hypothetical protein
MKQGNSSSAGGVSVLFAITWMLLRKNVIVNKSDFFFKYLGNWNSPRLQTKIQFLSHTEDNSYSLQPLAATRKWENKKCSQVLSFSTWHNKFRFSGSKTLGHSVIALYCGHFTEYTAKSFFMLQLVVQSITAEFERSGHRVWLRIPQESRLKATLQLKNNRTLFGYFCYVPFFACLLWM